MDNKPNRQQRRAAKKRGKRQGETYADQLTREKQIRESIDKTVRDESVALEADQKRQILLWEAVEALNRAFETEIPQEIYDDLLVKMEEGDHG